MKTKLLLIALAFGLMSGTCSTEAEPLQEDCNCEVQHYLYVPNVGRAGGTYQLQYSESIDFNCELEHGVYYPVSNVNYNYDKIVCE